MVELLKTKGGAKFEGGSRQPLIDQQLADLAKQIEENPEDPELRRQRVQEIRAALSNSKLVIAKQAPIPVVNWSA